MSNIPHDMERVEALCRKPSAEEWDAWRELIAEQAPDLYDMLIGEEYVA